MFYALNLFLIIFISKKTEPKARQRKRQIFVNEGHVDKFLNFSLGYNCKAINKDLSTLGNSL